MRHSFLIVGLTLTLVLFGVTTAGPGAQVCATLYDSGPASFCHAERSEASGYGRIIEPTYLSLARSFAVAQDDTRSMQTARDPVARAPATTASAPADYARADAETIRMHVQKILSDPRFATHKTFWQWLKEKLARWEGPRLSQRVKEIILWVVLAWCLLTLLAILTHLGWTIWLLVRPQRSSAGAALPAGSESYENASFEQLWEHAAELARAGSFRAATGVLLVALLRRLDTLKVLHFHKSKTNGEYLREYPSRHAGRHPFAQFVAAFERSIYGGSEVAGPTYDTMSTLAKQVLSDASQKPQI